MAGLDHRHVPPYLIDRLLAGVLPAEVAGAVDRQEQGCELCRERIADARTAGELFLERHPPERCARELQGRLSRARRRRRIAWGVPALSLLGVALFALGRAPLQGPTGAPGPIGQVEPSVSFSVYRPGSPGPRPGQSGERLRGGDAVQLHLDAGRFRGAHVFSLDEQGQAQPLFDWTPSSGGQPPTLVLDDTQDAEQIVVLFHDLPDPAIELPRLREAMARAYPGLGRAGVQPAFAGGPQTGQPGWGGSLPPPDGREIVTGSILIRKERSADAGILPDLSRTL